MSIRSRLYHLKKRFWSNTIILCYHRIGDYIADPLDITVSHKNFSSQIQWLNSNYNIISLDEIENYFLENK